MFSPAAMRKARIFILGRHMQRVAQALGQLGVMHLRSSVDEIGGQLQPKEVGEEIQRCRALEDRRRRLMALLQVAEVEPSPGAPPDSLDEIERSLSLLESLASSQRRPPAGMTLRCIRSDLHLGYL